MKHIKKRFLVELTEDEFNNSYGNKGPKFMETADKNIPTALKKDKNTEGFLVMKDKTYIKGFNIQINGTYYLLPDPDPTLIYFAAAQDKFIQLKEDKKNLLKGLDLSKKSEEQIHTIYFKFYINSCGCIIFLFTTIECFMNYLIPNDKPYVKVTSKKTESYNKEQIEKYISFEEKFKEVIPFFTHINFHKTNPILYTHINNLKLLRDEIIHTKSKKEEPIMYDSVVKKIINFKYDDTIESVAKFINVHIPNKIMECQCGADF